MKRIIVTGGAGFIGSNLVRQLQQGAPGAHLLVIDDLRSGDFANLVPEGSRGFSFHGDLIAQPLHRLDLAELVQRFEPDVIFHEASITDTTVDDQATMVWDNVEPFRRLLDIVARTGIKLVWASSAATYGTRANGATAARRPFRLEDAGHPANVYGLSKWIMENLHRRFVAEHPEAHVVGLRYFNVFGPGEQHKGKMSSMVFQLARQMLAGRRPRIFIDGEQARDQVFVQDVVEATLTAAVSGAGGIYNVGSGQAISFNQIIDALNKGLGTALEPDYFENPYSFYQDYTCADLTETRASLRWEPSHDVREMIIDWARTLQAQARPAADPDALAGHAGS